MPAKPDAFLSYTRFDDQKGRISEFCNELSYAVEAVSGEPFDVFQDIDGIGIGEHWQGKLDEMLSQARFFIPIVTPKFFKSEPCRRELVKFLEQERKVGRKDLVFPIYWIKSDKLEDEDLASKDDLARIINERQRWDWRRHRHRQFSEIDVAEQIEALAIQIDRARNNPQRSTKAREQQVGKASGDHRCSPSITSASAIVAAAQPTVAGDVDRSTLSPSFSDAWSLLRPEMVEIPAGMFQMGAPDHEQGRRGIEGPQHRVTISQNFAMGRFPVTFDEYDQFCEQTEREKPGDEGWGRGRRPVVNVSHKDAEAYCHWLSRITGASYRLPTEAEWEYACRAGSSEAFAFGTSIDEAQANFDGNVDKTSEVGLYLANAWGLKDMHGNVWEWCADAPRTYRSQPVIDPEGVGLLRVLRGGSWLYAAQVLRSACRFAFEPAYRIHDFSFRCAQVLEPEDSQYRSVER